VAHFVLKTVKDQGQITVTLIKMAGYMSQDGLGHAWDSLGHLIEPITDNGGRVLLKAGRKCDNL